MRERLFLLAFLPLLCACHGRIGPYQDKFKWIIFGKIERMTPLHGRPRQVTEYIMEAKDTARPETRGLFFKRYGFNAEGTMTMNYSYMNDTPVIKIDRQPDADGMQEKMTNMYNGEITRYVSRKLRDGRYKIITPREGAKPTATIVSFLSGGDEILEAHYDDTAALRKPLLVIHSYFAGDRLIRIERVDSAGPRDERYYYSDFDSPDSVLYYVGDGLGRTLQRRTIIFRNGHGDAVRTVTIEGNDTVGLEYDRYRYDEKGNWIRQIAIPKIVRRNSYGGKDTMLTDREFVY